MNKSWADYFEKSFLAHVYLGHFNWDLIKDFPSQEKGDEAIGDRMCREVVAFIDENLDDAALLREGKLPAAFLAAVKKTPYPKLVCKKSLGGAELSNINVFRILQRAFDRNIPAALAMSMSNSFGVAALLPAYGEGDFKDFVTKRVTEGILSGWADTEPAGAANWLPMTKAISGDGGQTFEITGEKCYIGNGSVADVLLVSTTIEQDGKKPDCFLFAVDTTSKGFSVRKNHDFMGIAGAPIAALRFDRVKVDRRQLLETTEKHWRDTFLIEPLSALGRMFTVVAVTTAISKKCLQDMLSFQEQRIIDSRKLKTYKKIEALVTKTAAEIFALDSVVEWCLLGSDGSDLPNRWWEQTAAKNIASLAATRIADRAISLLGASGYERAESKKRLGLNEYPTERYYRDARAFRISGGVDFLIDHQASHRWLTSFFFNENFDHKARFADLRELSPIPRLDPDLSEENLRHLLALNQATKDLGENIQDVVSRFGIEELREMQPVIILFNRYANEIFTMSVTIARAKRLAKSTDSKMGRLAEEYCFEGVLKLEVLFSKLKSELGLVESKSSRREDVANLVKTHPKTFSILT